MVLKLLEWIKKQQSPRINKSYFARISDLFFTPSLQWPILNRRCWFGGGIHEEICLFYFLRVRFWLEIKQAENKTWNLKLANKSKYLKGRVCRYFERPAERQRRREASRRSGEQRNDNESSKHADIIIDSSRAAGRGRFQGGRGRFPGPAYKKGSFLLPRFSSGAEATK